MTLSEFLQRTRIRSLIDGTGPDVAAVLECESGLVLELRAGARHGYPHRWDGPWVAFQVTAVRGPVPEAWPALARYGAAPTLSASEIVRLLHDAGWPAVLGATTRKKRDNARRAE